MANIVYRGSTNPSLNGSTQNKGAPLLNTEIDGNYLGLQTDINLKAAIDSPTFTGTPAAPTAAAATNTTQLATTAFVFAERTNSATLTNKTLTNPTINAGSGTLVLPGAATPAQTTEGQIVWDTDDDLLTIGTGASRKTMVDTDSTQALFGKTYNKVTITQPTNSAVITIVDGKTFTLNNTLAFSGTDSSSIAFGTGGTVAYTNNKLSVFAATTSAELAGVISDETGSGALVFATSPTLSQATINTDVRVPVVYGSTSASGTLTLTSTTNATKGTVFLGGSGDAVRLNTTTNGVITTSSANGTLSVDTGTYYKAGGTDVAIADGGTGIGTAPSNGQILIGNAGAYSLGTLTPSTGISIANTAGAVTITNSGVTALTGTANQVAVSASTGSITISGPQDLHTTATPSFTQVTLGASPTALGHAASKSYVDSSIQNGTFSVGVSGSGLSGSGSFSANQGSNSSVTITSNATNANTASTIVFRDASGNFSASTITASLSGNASTSSTWQFARTLTIGNTGKGVDGSGAVSWSLAEIGAYAATNPAGYITSSASISGSAGSVAWTNVTGRPSAVSSFTNDSGYITSSASISGSAGSIVSQANSATITATSSNVGNQIVLRDVNGDFTAGTITATDFNSTSDARLKENISSISGIELIKDMIPVQFNWKNNGKKSYGLIAQELEQILPELVIEREDGMKGVSYIPIIAMLVDAVKTLDARVKQLETK